MYTPSPSTTSGLSRSRHCHSSATELLPSIARTNRPPALLTSATTSLEHPAARRPVPRAPQSRHRSNVIISPPVEHHRRGDTAVVNLHPPYHHQCVPLGLGFLPGTTFSSESPPTGRPESVGGAAPAKAGIESLVLVYWATPFP
jgi:hypothetical protein